MIQPCRRSFESLDGRSVSAEDAGFEWRPTMSQPRSVTSRGRAGQQSGKRCATDAKQGPGTRPEEKAGLIIFFGARQHNPLQLFRYFPGLTSEQALGRPLDVRSDIFSFGNAVVRSEVRLHLLQNFYKTRTTP